MTCRAVLLRSKTTAIVAGVLDRHAASWAKRLARLRDPDELSRAHRQYTDERWILSQSLAEAMRYDPDEVVFVCESPSACHCMENDASRPVITKEQFRYLVDNPDSEGSS